MACGFVAEIGCGGGGDGSGDDEGGGRRGGGGSGAVWGEFLFFLVDTGLLALLPQCVSLAACEDAWRCFFNCFPNSIWYALCCICFTSPASSYSYLRPGVAYRASPPPPPPHHYDACLPFLSRERSQRFLSPSTRVEFVRAMRWYKL